MADDPNEDSWLYGSNSNPDQPAESSEANANSESNIAAPAASSTPDKSTADAGRQPAAENELENAEDDPFAEAEMPGNGVGGNDDPFVSSTVSIPRNVRLVSGIIVDVLLLTVADARWWWRWPAGSRR